MISAILVLARTRLLVLRNEFRRARLISKLGQLLLLGGMIFLAVVAFNATRGLVGILRDPRVAEALAEAAATTPGLPAAIGPFLAAVPGALLLLITIALLFTVLTGLLNTLYLSGDIDTLLVAPVPMRAVFVVKFADALSTAYLLIGILVAPALIGYGIGMGYGWLYAALVPPTLLLLPLLPAALAATALMGIVRVLPASRARELIGLLGGLLGVAFYVLAQLSDLWSDSLERPETLGLLLLADAPWLPTAWAGRALAAAGAGDLGALLLNGALFVGVTLAAFAGCLLLAERLYYDGWANLASRGGRVRRRAGPAPAARAGWRATPVPAIFVKDLRLFTRDLRNLQQVIFPLAMAGIWVFNLLSGNAGRPPPADALGGAAAALDLAGLGIAFFIGLSLSGTMAGAGISREGRQLWILRLAPISSWQMLLAKLALAYLPYPLIGIPFALLLAALQGTAPLAVGQQIGLLLLAGLGAAAISLGIGARFPRLDWDNPQQQTTRRAGCLTLAAMPIFLGLLLLLVVGGGLLGGALGGALAPALTAAGWLLGAALTAAVTLAMLWLGASGVDQIEL